MTTRGYTWFIRQTCPGTHILITLNIHNKILFPSGFPTNARGCWRQMKHIYPLVSEVGTLWSCSSMVNSEFITTPFYKNKYNEYLLKITIHLEGPERTPIPNYLWQLRVSLKQWDRLQKWILRWCGSFDKACGIILGQGFKYERCSWWRYAFWNTVIVVSRLRAIKTRG